MGLVDQWECNPRSKGGTRGARAWIRKGSGGQRVRAQFKEQPRKGSSEDQCSGSLRVSTSSVFKKYMCTQSVMFYPRNGHL